MTLLARVVVGGAKQSNSDKGRDEQKESGCLLPGWDDWFCAQHSRAVGAVVGGAEARECLVDAARMQTRRGREEGRSMERADKEKNE